MVAPRIPRQRPLWRSTRPQPEHYRLHNPWPIRAAWLVILVCVIATLVIAVLEHPPLP